MNSGKCLGLLLGMGLPVQGVNSDGVVNWASEPTPEQAELAWQIIENFRPAEFHGALCYDAVDVDRATLGRINKALAPNKPDDLQALERELLLAETLAAVAVALVTGTLTDELRATLLANLQTWQAVLALRAEGVAFKAAHGWGTTAEKA